MERRYFPQQAAPVGIETRADGTEMIVGHGAVFFNADNPGTEFELWRDVRERIAPTAFNRAIADSDDARGLFNHDANHLLGRVSSGTMRLSVDAVGLRYEIDPPDTQAGRDVVESIKRGDLSGSSFAFTVGRESWETLPDGSEVRTIEEVGQLFDTGPVTYPAYEAASTGLRQLSVGDEARSSYEDWKQTAQAAADAITDQDDQRRARINASADAVQKEIDAG